MDDFQKKQYEQRKIDERLADSGMTNGSNQSLITQKQEEHRRKQEELNGGGCFAVGTKISTLDGFVPIEEVSESSSVLSLSKSGETNISRVFEVRRYRPARIWKICLTGHSQELRATWGHPFLTSRGVVRTRFLRRGDHLFKLNESNQIVRTCVASVEATKEREVVYNLIVDDDLSYFAGGVAVNSFSFAGKLRLACLKFRRYRGLATPTLPRFDVRP
ncbi:hypothetical protein TRP8649_01386 [Pelagimonas phthalicica]|uniref:Hint domain-containing protein n=1 Tax=Pelagimonas phthalicica TaxID=1037362 RepID=A0A238JA88_9RHOB|nr:polymorphic toxin-type HINT domain-containing protein [Pelagimonas phthalicica]TDS94192.1 intein [Pelagimonas phthalicica]SMX27283.1 hypothetical protein TRP8649_01386 [Pelagimonas phthalicica]